MAVVIIEALIDAVADVLADVEKQTVGDNTGSCKTQGSTLSSG